MEEIKRTHLSAMGYMICLSATTLSERRTDPSVSLIKSRYRS